MSNQISLLFARTINEPGHDKPLAKNNNADQLAHLHSLSKIFALHCQDLFDISQVYSVQIEPVVGYS